MKKLLLFLRQILVIHFLFILCFEQLKLFPELPVLSLNALLVVLVVVWKESLELLHQVVVALERGQYVLDEAVWVNIRIWPVQITVERAVGVVVGTN